MVKSQKRTPLKSGRPQTYNEASLDPLENICDIFKIHLRMPVRIRQLQNQTSFGDFLIHLIFRATTTHFGLIKV